MRLIRLREVMDCTGLARSTIYKYIAAGTFPKPVPLGGRTVAWLEAEVQDWIIARVEERDMDSLPMSLASSGQAWSAGGATTKEGMFTSRRGE